MLVGLVLGDGNADGADDADFHGFLFFIRGFRFANVEKWVYLCLKY